MTPTTEELARELGKLHTILHVAAGHPADDETDAETLRLVLPLRETLRAAAARLRELSEALKPFGEASRDCDDPDIHDGVSAWESPEAMHVCIRDFRRAAQLTEPTQPPGDAG